VNLPISKSLPRFSAALNWPLFGFARAVRSIVLNSIERRVWNPV
jgi:hypothetical protein